MNNEKKDKVFEKPLEKKFEFDETVAAVFDDMLDRSIPYYQEVMDLIAALIAKRSYRERDLRILDLGSSTARLLLKLHSCSEKPIRLKGIDNSEAMIERARKKCDAFGAKDIELVVGDILNYQITNEDIVIANYTLQFIRPIDRPELVRHIWEGLNDGGEFFFSEKVVFSDRQLDKAIIDIYYDYKRKQGYSEYEIAGKREALENILIPFTIEENIRMCRDAGFRSVDTLMQWANFVTFLAKK